MVQPWGSASADHAESSAGFRLCCNSCCNSCYSARGVTTILPQRKPPGFIYLYTRAFASLRQYTSLAPTLIKNSAPLHSNSPIERRGSEKRVADSVYLSCLGYRRFFRLLGPSVLSEFFLFRSNARIAPWAFSICSSGSYELYSEGQPAHLTR